MISYTRLIPVGELADNLDDPRLHIVDCRSSLLDHEKGRRDYLAAHIPGAIFADLDVDLAAPVTSDTGRHPLPDVDTFINTLQQWGISNDSQVVVYDDANGGIAARLWWMLRWLGHEDVAVLDGGYAAWTRARLPVSAEVPHPTRGTFAGAADDDKVWRTEHIEGRVRSGDPFVLVDARDGARFRGEMEPIDTVAGHVPGAVSLPFTQALNSDGTWRDVGALRSMWVSVPGVTAEQPWGVMCGSGVTACHLVLSALLAGLPEPRLYVGSWSEWIRREDRPVADRGPGAG